MPSVDVIVPCYNYGQFLRQCVTSALSQIGVDIRVLILDDASHDDTSEIATALAAEDPRVTFIRHRVNKGHIATYNEGIDWAGGDYMLLLSADDYLLPNALNRAAALMDAHSSVGFVFGRAVELLPDGSRTITSRVISDGCSEKILSGSDFIELSGAKNIVPTPTAVVRTSLQKRLRGYNPNLPHAGDMEMWFRIAANSAVGIFDQPLAVYRRHLANMSLSYQQRGLLPDIIQREAAFDYFMATEGQKLPDPERVRRRTLRLMSDETLSQASAAFNKGQLELCDELREHAVSRFAHAKRSGAWLRLAVKKKMGLNIWLAVQPLANIVRKRDAVMGDTDRDHAEILHNHPEL